MCHTEAEAKAWIARRLRQLDAEGVATDRDSLKREITLPPAATPKKTSDAPAKPPHHGTRCECHLCCYARKHPQLRPREEPRDTDYGGVLGADGQIHSDADPGL